MARRKLFTMVQVREIRRLAVRTNLTQTQIGERFGCSAGTICEIVLGYTYKEPQLNNPASSKNAGSLPLGGRLSREDWEREKQLNVLNRPNRHKRNNAKLTMIDARKIRKMLTTTKLTQTQIGAKFGISTSAVSNIKNNLTWRENLAPRPCERE